MASSWCGSQASKVLGISVPQLYLATFTVLVDLSIPCLAFPKKSPCPYAAEMEDITFDASLVDDDLLDRIDFYGTKTDSQEYLPPAPAPPGGGLARQIAAAAEHDDLDTVKRLYEELRVLPGASYWTEDRAGLSSALYSAVLHRSRSVTSFLLERGVRPTMTHAREATNQRDTELLDTFLKHGWDINDTNGGPPPLS